jgi:required for meiotic nuclear division protein 1
MKINIAAYHISESLDIKTIKNEFAGSLIDGTSYDLFYSILENSYILILDYGVIVFAGLDEIDISKCLSLFQKYSKNQFEEKLFEDFEINDDVPLLFLIIQFRFQNLRQRYLRSSCSMSENQ